MPASLNRLSELRILVRQDYRWRSGNALYESRPRFTKLLTLGNTLGMREDAIEGLGVALLPEFVAEQEIRRRQLIKILPEATNQLKVYFCIRRIASEQTRYCEQLLKAAAAEINSFLDHTKQ